MAQELLRYQPTADGHEGWRARIAELVAIANEDLALGGAQGAGEPDPAAGHRAPGAGDGKATQAKKMGARSTSHKELIDYKNIEFRFTELKVLNKQYRIRVYFNLKFDSDFI
jgi:hypothetical protein